MTENVLPLFPGIGRVFHRHLYLSWGTVIPTTQSSKVQMPSGLQQEGGGRICELHAGQPHLIMIEINISHPKGPPYLLVL